MIEEIEESFTREREFLASVSDCKREQACESTRERECVRQCKRERQRERDIERNHRFRFSPEVKTETEPKLQFGYFFSTISVGSVRYFSIRYTFGEPYG